VPIRLIAEPSRRGPRAIGAVISKTTKMDNNFHPTSPSDDATARASTASSGQAPTVAVAPNAADDRPAPPRVRRILVVDDNVDAADSLAALLRAHGFVVDIANDGPAALAMMQEHTPDLALLDIGMPAMDGYELAAHLRFQPGCEDLPVVAVTGFGGPEDIRRSRAKGFAGHLVKPVDVASLVKFLK
jgi:CheY-like chemotaxis protein